jgi:hypothetical protein
LDRRRRHGGGEDENVGPEIGFPGSHRLHDHPGSENRDQAHWRDRLEGLHEAPATTAE